MVTQVLGPDDGDSEVREEGRVKQGGGGGAMGGAGRGGGGDGGGGVMVRGGEGRGPRGVPDTLWEKALRDSELFKDTYYLGV